MNYLAELDKDPTKGLLPQKFHDSASWQAWIRAKWTGDLRGSPRQGRLNDVVSLIGGYFETFTAHVPHDLTEGCGESSFLTRSYTRAATGSLAHDCVVDAIRWIHMLGGLLNPKRPVEGIKSSRIYLILMPPMSE